MRRAMCALKVCKHTWAVCLCMHMGVHMYVRGHVWIGVCAWGMHVCTGDARVHAWSAYMCTRVQGHACMGSARVHARVHVCARMGCVCRGREPLSQLVLKTDRKTYRHRSLDL